MNKLYNGMDPHNNNSLKGVGAGNLIDPLGKLCKILWKKLGMGFEFIKVTRINRQLMAKAEAVNPRIAND
jgi:hypothetical protein